ncbi:biotin synthesis protein BioH [Aurantiacibacter atlanticus]|uniref:Biotin synthesis protein BioH n=1 Tax=Aurantiacibacter atlanticus TaxID=1648404 RepID=A0A0H4VF37_9SPHN|nr:alpha/beta hydrolase [Aurantiacibacter atlanticus]AKQ43322.2 biotin synthesis protein BioH [Aurantiacibacter atlanticus]MDF1834217.1 alpha/beta hydrolase [Alteraurantiacibacter sp. bin_em_oilr2.035]
MTATLLFMHGWGFDGSIWSDVMRHLHGFDCHIGDRGYFGAPGELRAEGSCIVVGHSLGVMHWLADLPADCIGLVAVNGFDRFVEGDGFPGVPRRPLERMIARLPLDPVQSVADFRIRCGAGDKAGEPVVDTLLSDLELLRDGDYRDRICAIPAMSLQGVDDPLLPRDMREAVFAKASNLTRMACGTAGHLLPSEAPEWTASAIADFARAVA